LVKHEHMLLNLLCTDPSLNPKSANGTKELCHKSAFKYFLYLLWFHYTVCNYR